MYLVDFCCSHHFQEQLQVELMKLKSSLGKPSLHIATMRKVGNGFILYVAFILLILILLYVHEKNFRKENLAVFIGIKEAALDSDLIPNRSLKSSTFLVGTTYPGLLVACIL